MSRGPTFSRLSKDRIAQNRNLGLAIDFETATAHWHGERIDYDHALMVTMASWDSGDTRPEAGPAAGDWNSSQAHSGRMALHQRIDPLPKAEMFKPNREFRSA